MATAEKYLRQFESLDARAKAVRSHSDNLGMVYVEGEDWQNWATSALNLLKQVGGEGSVHFANLQNIYAEFQGYQSQFQRAYGVFAAAKNDYNNGMFSSLDAQISGEVFGDFVAAAKAALADGNKDAAAVLAGAALEDALKRFGKKHGLNVDGKDMSEVIGALKSKGLVGGAQKSILETMPKTRNAAMHADWAKLSPTEVGGVIGFTEQFLLQNFS